MATIKRIKNQRLFAEQLHGFVEISQEIAVTKMQHARQSVLTARLFMEGILAIFREVKLAHQKEVAQIIATHGASATEKKAKKKPAVTILLAPSGKFSGTLTPQIFHEFSVYLKKTPTDVVVVGETGREFITTSLGKAVAFEYFSVNLDHPTAEQIRALVIHIRQYESITIFTGKFENLVTQVPASFNISGYASLQKEQPVEQPIPRSFLFEPSLEEIMDFFNTQVTAFLFIQTLSESKLANLGSRIMALENSRTGISIEISLMNRQLVRLNRRLEGRKQLQRLSGMQLWSGQKYRTS